MNHILVFAVHPDDETLGCGGTLLKYKDNGDRISWLIVTTIPKNSGYSNELISNRKKEIEIVSNMYGFDHVINLELPTTKLDDVSFSRLVQLFSEKINSIKPDIIILPNRSDVHSDHKICFDAAYSCTKNFRYPFIKKILMCETLSETEFSPAFSENAFLPNLFVDISMYMEKKLEIMSVYESEVMVDNLPRSINAIKALASYRGSRIGVNYAESFMLLFEKA